MKKLFSFYFERFNLQNRILYVLIFFTSLVSIFFGLIFPLLQRYILDELESELNNFILISLLLVGLLNILALLSEAIILEKLKIDFQYKIHQDLIGSAIRYNSKIIHQRGSGAFMSIMYGDSEQLAGLLKTNYIAGVMVIISTLIIIVLTSQWSWIFPIVVLPIYIITLVVIYISNKVFFKHRKLGFENYVVKLNPRILEYLDNRISLLGFSQISSIENELFNEFQKRDQHFKKAFIAQKISNSILEALKTLGLIIIFILAVHEISSNRLNLVTLVALLSYYGIVFVPISAVQNMLSANSAFKQHLARLEEDLSTRPNLKLPSDNKLLINQGCFTYEGSDNNYLKDITLDINNRIGLIGMSGAGKSTIIKMLLGELVPRSGSCTLGGTNTYEVSKAVLFGAIHIYNQENEIFDETLNYNITLGKIGLADYEYEAQVGAYIQRFETVELNSDYDLLTELFLLQNKDKVKAGLFNELIIELENKKNLIPFFAKILTSRKYYIKERYDKICDELQINHLNDRLLGNKGVNVSGGEKNRICLARFLLPQNENFFIVDEPLVSVDAITEEKCTIALQKFLGKKGVIISHKLNLIRTLCDDIYLIQSGEITESGTHDSLMSQKQLYSELYEKYTSLNSS